jgi:hypothetical protein
MLPRHFVASRTPAEQAVGPIVRLLDTFELQTHDATLEVVVGVDEGGRLVCSIGGDHPTLTPAARAELTVQDMVTPSRRRVIEAEALFFFELQLVEQAADTPGRNDPVFLYGTLVTPEGERLNGQLTQSRADLLEGFVSARRWAFGRCFHALLPAERDEAIADGRGLVLAYPVMPADVWDSTASNEGLVSHLLFDLLDGLRRDILRDDARRGLLAKLFVQSDAHRVQLAAKSVEAWLDSARAALTLFEGWPSPRAKQLRARVRPFAGPVSVRAAPPPRPTTPPAPTPQRAPTRDTSWVNDFLSAHGGTPRLTTGDHSGSWNDDFKSFEEPKQSADGSSDRPEWMKDFE